MKTFPIQGQFNRVKWDREKVVEHFPYMQIPWGMISGHEAQSQKNHSQSLQRIAERGGFSRAEAIAVIEDRDFTKPYLNEEQADVKLKQMVADFLNLRPSAESADNPI